MGDKDVTPPPPGFMRVHWISRMLDKLDEADTKRIIHRYLADETPTPSESKTELECVLDDYREPIEFTGRAPRTDVPASSSRPSFSIIIPFARHLDLFKRCLASVVRLAECRNECPLEILIINDDANYSESQLRGFIPPTLTGLAVVSRNAQSRGIANALNTGIKLARNEWILFLDCDDLIEADALGRLSKHIGGYPKVRYFSSNMIDIDERDRILRYRRRVASPATLLSNGMLAGHLKCIRRDVFEEYGLLDPSVDGCQDYDLALKVSFAEPLLFIQDYLYRYRWHTNTQSVSQRARQAAITRAIVHKYKCAAMINRGLLPATADIELARTNDIDSKTVD
jgi:glycosyltransferase involved in cell wall biosynthesis